MSSPHAHVYSPKTPNIFIFNFIPLKKTKLTLIHIVFNAKTTIKKNPKSSCLVVITVQPKIKKTFRSKLFFVFILNQGIIVFRLFIFARKD
jgi:hypothetical protein